MTTVTASSLSNSGSVNVIGGTYGADLVVNGAAENSGTLTIGSYGELDVTGTNTFEQDAGVATISGSLVAATVAVDGGLLNLANAITSGDGIGVLDIGSAGNLEFGASVDSSHNVTFTVATGTLSLGAPTSFAGTISGFSGSDVIDLLSTTASSLSYSGSASSGTLTVTESSGSTFSLAFAGNYTTANFNIVPDASGGTEIIDPRHTRDSASAPSQPAATRLPANHNPLIQTVAPAFIAGVEGPSASPLYRASGFVLGDRPSENLDLHALPVASLGLIQMLSLDHGTSPAFINLDDGQASVHLGAQAPHSVLNLPSHWAFLIAPGNH